jgi:hypothetical protein
MLQMALMLSMAQEVEAEQQPALEAAAPAAPTAEAGPATIFEAPATQRASTAPSHCSERVRVAAARARTHHTTAARVESESQHREGQPDCCLTQ